MRGFDRRNGVGRTRRQKRRLLMKCGNRSRRFHRIVQVVGESCTHFPFRMRRISSQRIEIASNAGILSRSPPGNQTRCCPESIRAPKMKNNSPLCESCRFPKRAANLRAIGQKIPAAPPQSLSASSKPTHDNIPSPDSTGGTLALSAGWVRLLSSKRQFLFHATPLKNRWTQMSRFDRIRTTLVRKLE